jgi:hypothetical protein
MTLEMPSASIDLNLFDYFFFAKLEIDMCAKPHKSLGTLKKTFLTKWELFPMKSDRNS